jgi:hypothetical protein
MVGAYLGRPDEEVTEVLETQNDENRTQRSLPLRQRGKIQKVLFGRSKRRERRVRLKVNFFILEYR